MLLRSRFMSVLSPFSSCAVLRCTCCSVGAVRLWALSRNRNLLHAATSDLGVLCSPNPITCLPDALIRMASGVKSQSDDTRQNTSTLLRNSKSITSMVMAMSVAFLPLV